MKNIYRGASTILLLVLAVFLAQGQSTDPHTAMIAKGKDFWPSPDSRASKGFFNPLYFRTGLMSGVIAPFSSNPGIATLGIRTEYGLSKLFSVVGDLQANSTSGSPTQGQGSLAARYMPFNFGRFQPYVSVGFGAGSTNKAEGYGHCHHGFMPPVTTTAQTTGETTVTTSQEHYRLQGFAMIQLGANFKVANHFIAHVESSFQAMRHQAPGGLALRAGMSYQFGKN